MKVNMNEIAKKNMQVDVKVTGMRVFWAKLAVAMALIKLASLVLGVGVRVETDIKLKEKA